MSSYSISNARRRRRLSQARRENRISLEVYARLASRRCYILRLYWWLALKRHSSSACSTSPLQRQINFVYPRPRCNINATTNGFPEKRVIAKGITLRLWLAFTNKCHSGFTLNRKSRWRRPPHPLGPPAPAHNNWIFHARLSTPPCDGPPLQCYVL